MSALTPPPTTVVIRFKRGDKVNAVAAAVAHHQATNHPMGGGGFDADCEVCEFAVQDGVVTGAGVGRISAELKY